MADIRELKDQAAKHFSKGKFEKAAAAYEELCRLEPQDSQLRVRLGDSYAKRGDKPKAIGAYQIAAEAYARQGFLPRAIAVCKLILEIDSAHKETQQVLAQLYAKKSGRAIDEPRQMPVARPVTAAGRPAAPPPAPAASAPPRAPAAPPPPPATAAGEEGLELDTSDRGFSAGVKVVAEAGDSAPAEASGLELDTGSDAHQSWKGAKAWEAHGTVADDQPKAAAPAAPAKPSAPPPAPSAAAVPPAPKAAAPAAPAPAHKAAPTVAPIKSLELPDDDALFASAGMEPQAPAAKPAFSLADVDLGEPELALGGPAPAPNAPAAAPAKGGAWFAPPEEAQQSAAAPKNLAQLDIASVDEEAQLESLLTTQDRPADAGALPEIPLFSDLSREAFVELTSQCALKRAEPGEVLVEEGSIGTSFFVISSGSVKVCKKNPDGGEILLAKLGEGAFFGEMALLSGTPRGASVIAEEPTDCLEITAPLIARLQQRYPHVGQVLKKFCRQRLLANIMATSPLFKPFEKNERRSLIERFRAREVAPRESVVDEGKLSDGLYVVMAGEFEVYKNGDEGLVKLATLKEGDLFGEISLLTKSPATATVVATKKSTVLRLPREAFDEVISTHPQVLMLVSELSDERLRVQQAIVSGAVAIGEEGLMLV